MDKPDVDSIEGLSPAISIDQKTTSRNPRSTVGTVTEIYDYLRLLWARVGHPHCFNCGEPIAAQSAEQIVDQVMMLAEGTRFMVEAPVVRGRKGEYGKLLDELRAEGFTRVKVDGELRRGPFARARLAARGVVASVAARLAVAAAGDDAERFDPLAVAGDGPLLGGPRLGVEAGGTFRLDRQVILDVAPAVHLAPAGAAVTGGATLRLVRAWGENELQARLAVAALPGGGDHAAVGAALLLPRGRAPDWRVGAWLGYGETGLLPGVTLALAEGLPGGGRAALTAAYEPYRRDARPLRGTVTLELPLAGPTARLEVAAGALHPRAPDAVAGRLSLAWPFER